MTSTQHEKWKPSLQPSLSDTHPPLYAQMRPTSHSNPQPKSQISHERREKAPALHIIVRRRSRPPATWKGNYWRAVASLTREGTRNPPTGENSQLQLEPLNQDERARANGAENQGADSMVPPSGGPSKTLDDPYFWYGPTPKLDRIYNAGRMTCAPSHPMDVSQQILEPKPLSASQMTGLARVRTHSLYYIGEMSTEATIVVYRAKKGMQ